MIELLVPDTSDVESQDLYRRSLRAYRGLPHTQIVVQSGFAPGGDTIVSEVALEHGFSIRGVLPFEEDLYANASTFVRTERNANGLLYLSDEDRERQAKYRELLEKAKNDPNNRESGIDSFAVRLQRDRDLKKADIHKRMTAELDIQAFQDERYYAAGEFLAVTSHLMIAIWNGVDDGSLSGASAVVKARLEGPRPNLLATSQGLVMPHGGPLIILHAEKIKPIPAGVTLPPKLRPPIEFRFPFSPETKPDGTFKADDSVLAFINILEAERESDITKKNVSKTFHEPGHSVNDWRSNQIALCCRVAANLERFNTICIKNPKSSEDEFKKRITTQDKIELFACPGSSPIECQFKNGLRRISDLQQRADDAEGQLRKRVNHCLSGMFLLTLLAAICWHFFCHWHPREDTPKPPQNQATNVNAANDHQPDDEAGRERMMTHISAGADLDHGHSKSALRGWMACVSVTSVLLGILIYLIAAWYQMAEQQHDCRALAEGLRVQFFWNMAGLGESVSANYMHRQRSELDWIRGAIRGASIPYERWRDLFDGLSPIEKCQALKTVHDCWIIDQYNYFRNRCKEHHWRLHAYHKLGKLLAVAGLICAVFWWKCLMHFEHCSLENAPLTLFGLWFTIVTVAIGNCQIRHPLSAKSHGEHLPDKPQPWEKVMHSIIPDLNSNSGPIVRAPSRSITLAWNLLRYLPAAIWLATLAITLSFTLETIFKKFPETEHWGIIITGSQFVMGGLSIAWAEKNLYSELAYQFETMRALFRHADKHVARELEQLLVDVGKPEVFDPRLKNVQNFLVALGKEALDENAEWLLLHRARPLEPVMAG